MKQMKKPSRPGRPPSASAVPTVRISPHFPVPLADRVKQASALRGMSVVAFVMEAARREAEAVIEEEGRLHFSAQEMKKLATLLARPPQVNAAAREAAQLAAGVEIRS